MNTGRNSVYYAMEWVMSPPSGGVLRHMALASFWLTED
jgi:hypothetical protein